MTRPRLWRRSGTRSWVVRAEFSTSTTTSAQAKKREHLLAESSSVCSCATCIQAAAKAVNARIKALAYVLNSAFSLDDETHTDSFAGEASVHIYKVN